MSFKFSQRSLSNLQGVDQELVDIAHKALSLSSIDFGVIQGLRTEEEQRALVAKGASQTMKSKHLLGLAIDVMAYVGPRASWELRLYDDIADAFKKASVMNSTKIRWGGAWHIPNIAEWDGTMQDALDDYVMTRRSQGRRIFIDAGHFELNN